MSSNTETATVFQGGVAASLVPACTFFPLPTTASVSLPQDMGMLVAGSYKMAEPWL